MDKQKLDTLPDLLSVELKSLLIEIANNSPDHSVYLGGGYLRDVFTGNTPKDIDIFLAPKKEGVVLGNEYIPAGCMVNYRKGVDDIVIASDMEARGLQRLVGLWSTNVYPSKEVQYIVYKKPMSLMEVALDFDMGICQIAYDPLTEVLVYTDNFVKGHTDKVIECFHQYDEDRTIARFERMEAKFPDYRVVGKPDVEAILKVRTSSGSKSQSNSV